MTKNNLNFSIVIPILNESKNIKVLTNKIILNCKNFNYEIIFVDDNSSDGSKKILEILKNKYKIFRPILRKKELRDLSQSCIEGIQKSKSKNVIIMDGDLQHDPKYIKSIYNRYTKKKLDIVVASRDLISGKNPGLSYLRRMASIVLIFVLSLFNFQTKDPMSGYFIFRKKIFQKNKKKLFGRGYKILADLIINSNSKLKIEDFDIIFNRRYKDRSKMNYKILLILGVFYFRCLTKKIF